MSHPINFANVVVAGVESLLNKEKYRYETGVYITKVSTQFEETIIESALETLNEIKLYGNNASKEALANTSALLDFFNDRETVNTYHVIELARILSTFKEPEIASAWTH